MLSHEQKTFSNFQKITKTQQEAAEKYKKSMNWRTRHRIHYQYQEKKNMSSNQQCIEYQLYEFTTMKKLENKRKRTETIANHEKCKMKWNNKSHKKNEKNKHEHYQSLRINNI